MSRELDALVAEKVMGWHIVIDHAYAKCNEMWYSIDRGVATWQAQVNDFVNDYGLNRGGGWHPSTDIACAWQVVEKLIAEWAFLLEVDTHVKCYASFYRVNADDQAEERFGLYADTAPLAICLAALKACGVEVPA